MCDPKKQINEIMVLISFCDQNNLILSFRDNMSGFSEKQEERFHQDMIEMNARSIYFVCKTEETEKPNTEKTEEILLVVRSKQKLSAVRESESEPLYHFFFI